MKNALSARLLKASVIFTLYAIIWFGVSWLVMFHILEQNETWLLCSIKLGIFSIILLHVKFFLGYWSLKTRWYIKPLLWIILGVVFFFWWQHLIYAIRPLLTYDYNIVSNWQDILQVYAIAGGLGVFIALAPVKFKYFVDGLRENKYWRQWFIENRGAGASFAGVASFRKKSIRLRWFLKSSGSTTRHIIWGRSLWMDDPKMRLIADNENSHNIVCAGARSGKSISCIYNVLLSYKNPAIVFDPRGEHTKQTFYRRASKLFLKKRGQKGRAKKHLRNGECYVLDPFHETDIASCSYNPLSEIVIDDPRVRERISAISNGCVSPEKGDNKHFEEFAKYLIEGVIAYVLGNCAPQNQNLVFVCDLINGIDNEIGVARSEKFNELLVRMLMDTQSAGGLPAEAAMRLKDMGDRERGSILSTVARSLKWISDPAMRKHLQGDSDFKFTDIGTEKRIQTIYIVLPEGLMSEAAQMRWLRVLTNLGIVLLRNRPKSKEIPETLFVLDEFARLGRLQMISEGISTLMGDKIRLLIALQNLGQLKQDYPERWNSFIANSSLQFFGVHDLETARFISDMLGERIEKTKNKRTGETKKEKIPLMTPQEIMIFLSKKKNRQIVFPVEGLPLRLERVSYKRIKGFHSIGSFRRHYEF